MRTIFRKPLIHSQTQKLIQSYTLTLNLRKRKRQEQVGVSVDELASMGFERGRATIALEDGGNREDIIQSLLSEANPASSTNNGGEESSGVGAQGSTSNATNGRAEQDTEMKYETTDEIENQGSTSSDGVEERDAEIEDEIAKEIGKVDALLAYDINLDREIEAINEYLCLLDSS